MYTLKVLKVVYMSQLRAALCFSGHCRNFELCYPSIYEHVIKPLEAGGYEVDTFLATWDNLGHRSQGFEGKTDFAKVVELLKPKSVSIEKFDRERYSSRYRSNQWQAQPHLRNANTAPDAISMWQRVYSSWDLMDKYRRVRGGNTSNDYYNVIFRMRPDIVYDTALAVNDVKNLIPNTVYMAKWHGKYPEVTYEMMDHFAFGNVKTMDHYMTLALLIDAYFRNTNIVQTAEGFLYRHLVTTDIQRIDLQYSVQRADKIEEVTPR